MAAAVHPNRLSAGVVIVNGVPSAMRFLLLRAYKNWDFPKGMVETGEFPLQAAIREVREETTLNALVFDWGENFLETGPYNKGKISRYYVARSEVTDVRLPVNPELGVPEHHEARWMTLEHALKIVVPRLEPVLIWAHGIISPRPSLRP